MKKGCFIKTVVILTILVASALYIIENKFDEFIGKPGKKYLADLIKIGLNEDLNRIKASTEKDSLNEMIENYIDEIKNSDKLKISSDDGEGLVNEIKIAAEDSILTTDELKDISKILEQMRNERLQKN